MIIDMHTHTFPDKVAGPALAQMEKAVKDKSGYDVKVKTAGTLVALSESTKKSGIDLSVVVPVATKPEQTESINKFAQKTNEKMDETCVFSFGAIHPNNADYRKILDEVKAMELKGIKLHPDYQKVMFDDERYLRIMDYAANLGLIIITHAGQDIGFPEKIHCTPDSVVNVLKHIQPEKLILAHNGGWNMWDEVEEKLVGRSVYFDTSSSFEVGPPHIEGEQFKRIVKNHGADKIVFATDSPWSDQKKSLDKIRAMGFDSETEKKILGGNAKRILGIV